jgi:AraC-like DNA-binding protein
MRQRLHIPNSLDGSLWRYGNAASANRRHTHAELEFNLVTRGSGTYLVGNRRYGIRRGDLLWLFPAQEHVLIEQSAEFEMWIAVFRRKAVKRAATDADSLALLRPSLEGEVCRRVTQHDLTRLEELFAEIAACREQPGLFNSGLGYALLNSWQCFQRAAGVAVRDVHPAVERAARLIRDESNSLSLNELAHRSGLSAARLSRLFKQQTGFAMADFRNRKRLERFVDIYGTGQRHTMLDAALEAGFGSYAQFHRIFRRNMGCSPGEYRRKIS